MRHNLEHHKTGASRSTRHAEAARHNTNEAAAKQNGRHGEKEERHGRRGRGRHAEAHGAPVGIENRVRRGEARFILLDVLSHEPRHGYEIIRILEEKSNGRYVPSPGTVYPSLQYLEDLGLIVAKQDGERRVYSITEAGKTELEAKQAEVDAFWQRLKENTPSASQWVNAGILQEEIQFLTQTCWRAYKTAEETGSKEIVQQIQQALENCRNEIRSIITKHFAEPAQEETNG